MKSMGGKIKNLFLNFNWNKKQLILAVLFFLILGLTLPKTGLAQGIIETILGIAAAPIYIAISIIIGVLGFISIGIFTLIIAPLTNWAISDVFLNVELIKGPFIEMAWAFTRDLVSMVFIIILAFIGIATILRIKEYEMGKILPKLIIIALLINFSPVIVGAIVDAANILMNFFLVSVRETLGSFPEAIQGLGNFFVKLAEGMGDLTKMTAAIAYGIAVIVFYSLVSLIYLLIALIFFFRIIAIWTLVILSPIAFACFILPVTKKWWDMWWNQLIQWSIIGVITAFFLYLGSHLLGLSSIIISTEELTIEEEAIASIFPHFIALVFMGIGIMLGLQTGAMGARGIISGTKGFGKWIYTRRPTQRALGSLVGGTARVLTGAAPFMRRLEERAGKVRFIGKGLKPAAALLSRPYGWAVSGVGRLAGPPLMRYAARARAIPIPKEFDEMSSHEQAEYTKLQTLDTDKLKFIGRMIKLDTLKYEPDIQKMAVEYQERFAESPYYKKEVGDIQDVMPDKVTVKSAIDFEVGEEAKDKMQDKINEAAEEITVKAKIDVELNEKIEEEAGKKGLTKEQTIKDIAAGAVHARELKPKDMAPMIKGSLTSLATRIGSQSWTSGHLQRLIESWPREIVENVLNQPGGLNATIKSSEDLEEFARDPGRRRLIHFFARTPAGRAWNWAGLNYMRDPEGQPTTNFEDFEKTLRIQEELDKTPELKTFNKLHVEANRYQRRIEELQRRGQSTTHWEDRYRETSIKLTSRWEQIEKDKQLREKWEEIKKLR